MLHHASKKVATHHCESDGKIFAWLGLIAGVGASAFDTIFPLILLDATGSEVKVGWYFALISLVCLLTSLGSTLLFNRFSKVWITKIVLMVSFLALLLLTLAERVWHIAGFDIPRAICISLFWIAISLFVADYATKKNLALAEGRYYLFSNIGYFVGPLLAGYGASHFGQQSVFLIAAASFFVALLLFLHAHVVLRHPHIHHEKSETSLREIWQSIKFYFQNVELRKVLLIAFGLNVWWAVSSIYMPMQVEQLGYGEEMIGWIFAASMLPLIFLEKSVGRWANRRGVRPFLILGFSILTVFVASFSLLAAVPLILFLAFVLVNIGAAFIEPLQETYYFKAVPSQKKEKLFGVYNSADPIANVIAPFLASFFFFVGSYNFLWAMTAVWMLLFVFVAWRIKKGL